MKKYFKLSFDGVSYYEYIDASKTAVRKTAKTKNDTDDRFMHAYFEESNSYFKCVELTTGKGFRLGNNMSFKGRHIALGYLEFRNASMSECSRKEIASNLRKLSDESKLKDYASFMRKLFEESYECFKLAESSQIKVERRSIRRTDGSFGLNGDKYAEAKLASIRKNEILLGLCRRRGIKK